MFVSTSMPRSEDVKIFQKKDKSSGSHPVAKISHCLYQIEEEAEEVTDSFVSLTADMERKVSGEQVIHKSIPADSSLAFLKH